MNNNRLISKFITKYAENFKGLSLLAWKGIFISLSESLLISVCYFFSLYFVYVLHMSVSDAGILMSFYGCGTILGSVVSGKLSDRINPNIVSVICLFIQSAAFIIFTHVHQYFYYALNLLLIGFASYGFIVSNHTWVLSNCHDGEVQRLKAINILGVTSNLGLGLSAIIIGFIDINAFTLLLMVASILLLGMAIYLGVIGKSWSSEPKIKNEAVIQPLSHVFTKQSLVILTLFSLFISGIIISQTNCTYSVFLQNMFPRMGIHSFSILFMINTLMVVFLQTPISNLFAKKNKIVTMGGSAFLIGFSMLLLNYIHNYLGAIIACIVMTIGEIIFFSFSFSICYESGDDDNKGKAVGTYRLMYAMSRVVGPFFGGLIYGKFSGKILWTTCGWLGALVLLLTIIYAYTAPKKLCVSSE